MVYSYDSFLQQLGKRLRQLREERGWTLRHMIVAHGFHLAQWQGFEKGTGISVPTLLRLCGVFDVTLEELIGDLGRSKEKSPDQTDRTDAQQAEDRGQLPAKDEA